MSHALANLLAIIASGLFIWAEARERKVRWDYAGAYFLMAMAFDLRSPA